MATYTVFYLPGRKHIPTVCQTSGHPLKETWGDLGLTEFKFDNASRIYQLLLPHGRAVCENVLMLTSIQ
jgi:hypothetical protein